MDRKKTLLLLLTLFFSRRYQADAAFSAPKTIGSWSLPCVSFTSSVDIVKIEKASQSSGRSITEKLFSFGKKTKSHQAEKRFTFPYDNDLLQLGSTKANATTTGIILIHPIGVGIARWFYHRLMGSLHEQYTNSQNSTYYQGNYVICVPDLLGSGTACNPILRNPLPSNQTREVNQLPLLTVEDWAKQITALMATLEKEITDIDRWCIVTNGGCSPIALQIAKNSLQPQKQQDYLFQEPVTNVILSSVPRLSFFLPENDGEQDRQDRFRKVQKSYKRLCGIIGRLFWWYALRNNGKFIRKFSEKNLVADPRNLGEDWLPNCVNTANMYEGKSRYSTFSFLAGSLQAQGCRDSLETLRGSDTVVDIIRGRDRRRNRARSWFWQKRKQNQPSEMERRQLETLDDVLLSNGNRGKVLECGGRVSLAYEDAPGYAEAMMELLTTPQ